MTEIFTKALGYLQNGLSGTFASFDRILALSAIDWLEQFSKSMLPREYEEGQTVIDRTVRALIDGTFEVYKIKAATVA